MTYIAAVLGGAGSSRNIREAGQRLLARIAIGAGADLIGGHVVEKHGNVAYRQGHAAGQ